MVQGLTLFNTTIGRAVKLSLVATVMVQPMHGLAPPKATMGKARSLAVVAAVMWLRSFELEALVGWVATRAYQLNQQSSVSLLRGSHMPQKLAGSQKEALLQRKRSTGRSQ